MARAYAIAGDRLPRDRYLALAQDELQRADDHEDRQLIESQLATIPRG